MSDQSLSVHMIAERSKRRNLVAAISESVMLQALVDSCMALLVIRDVSPIPDKDNVPRRSDCPVLRLDVSHGWLQCLTMSTAYCVQCSPRQENILQRSLTVTIVSVNYIGMGSEHPNVMQCWSGYKIEYPQ